MNAKERSLIKRTYLRVFF